VKYGKKMQVTLVQCSLRLMWEKLWKSQMFLNGINSSVRVCMLKSQMKTMPITVFSIKDTVHFKFIPQSQSTKRIMQKY